MDDPRALKIRIPEYYDPFDYHRVFNYKYPLAMQRDVEEARIARCYSAVSKIMRELKKIDPIYIKKLYQNSMQDDPAHRIMQVYDSLARTKECLDAIHNSFFYDCGVDDKMQLLEYYERYIINSHFFRHYTEYVQNPRTRAIHPKVVKSCQKKFYDINTIINRVRREVGL